MKETWASRFLNLINIQSYVKVLLLCIITVLIRIKYMFSSVYVEEKECF